MIWGNRYDRNWFFFICTQNSPLKLSNLGLFFCFWELPFYYKFNFTSSDQSVQTVFLLDLVLAGCIFLIFFISSRLSSLLLIIFSHNFMCCCVYQLLFLLFHLFCSFESSFLLGEPS